MCVCDWFVEGVRVGVKVGGIVLVVLVIFIVSDLCVVCCLVSWWYVVGF